MTKETEETDEEDSDEESEFEEDDKEIEEDNSSISTKEAGIGVRFEYPLHELFKSIRHLNDINIKATKEGLEFWGMNSSNSMMTQVKVGEENIKNYDFKEDLEISTDIDYLKIVKRLLLVKAYINEQRMVFEESKTKIELPVLEKGMEKIPELDLKKAVSFELTPEEVRKTLNDITAVGSEDFSLEFKNNLAVFTAKGKYGTLTKTLEPYKEGIIKFEKAKNSIKVGLSVDLLKSALNGMGKRMKITIGDNSPLIVENQYRYEEEDNKNKYYYERKPPVEKVTHYLAPRSQ